MKHFPFWPFRSRQALPAPAPVRLLPRVRDAPAPPPEPPPPLKGDAIAYELARLAGRIVKARGARDSGDEATASELTTLLRQLASLEASGARRLSTGAQLSCV